MRVLGRGAPKVLDWPVSVGGVYILAWMFPGAWVGAISEGILGGVPEGWAFCFPNLGPAFLSGLALATLLPLMRPPRLRPVPYAVYGVALPLVVTLAWLAWHAPPVVNNLSLRWWVSHQVPAMLVASCFAVHAALERIRAEGESIASPITPDSDGIHIS